MVGIAVGLFIVAGATMVVTTQLGDNRRLLLETQLQQDLRATADIITRELRRAGAEGSATSHVWAPADAAVHQAHRPTSIKTTALARLSFAMSVWPIPAPGDSSWSPDPWAAWTVA